MTTSAKSASFEPAAVAQIVKPRKRRKFGLVWDAEKTREEFPVETRGTLPILTLAEDACVGDKDSASTHVMIEGDNYHSLVVLSYTHEATFDVIYIDPPYNTGKRDFRYNDAFVDEEDGYRHSKWLSFMERRLRVAHRLLAPHGVMIVHIDEHEQSRLHLLLEQVFGPSSDLGTIVWDKRNPKGDARKIAYQHESILVFAKDSEAFARRNPLKRPKPNAEAMLAKAASLVAKVGKSAIPSDLEKVIRKYDLPNSLGKKHASEYTLDQATSDFQAWIAENPELSGGERQYKLLDENGEVYRPVYMGWPNKKKAPDDYFKPLTHPTSRRHCPVPERGWRYPPETMKRLMAEGKILFGPDESTQPQRKYLLRENMWENLPSVLRYGGSDDALFAQLGLSFENPKPTEFAAQLLRVFAAGKHDLVLDFFAGSGTALHAVALLNAADGGCRRAFLCTNNEAGIAREVCLPRIKAVVNGKRKASPPFKRVGGALRYYETAFAPMANTDRTRWEFAHKATELLCLRESAFKCEIHSHGWSVYSGDRVFLGILMRPSENIEPFREYIRKFTRRTVVYVFSQSSDDYADEFIELPHVVVAAIPEAILKAYRRAKHI